jgi:hypothetical protein
MKRYLVLLAGVGALGVAGFLWKGGAVSVTPKPAIPQGTVDADSTPSDGAGALDQSHPSVLALRQELAVLREELAELRKRPEPRGVASAVSVTGDTPNQPPPLDPREMERQQEEWHGHMAEVEAAFHGEDRDPRWAADTKFAVDTAFRVDPSFAAKLRTVDCRSRTCRLELSDDGPEPMGDKLIPILAQLGSTLPKVKSDQIVAANGSKTLVLFMSRRPEG